MLLLHLSTTRVLHIHIDRMATFEQGVLSTCIITTRSCKSDSTATNELNRSRPDSIIFDVTTRAV